jgi:hypothetical protein
VRASCSMFSQILKLVPRIEFERMVRRTGAEYAAKGFSSWSQFVAMLFCQLGRAHSLREIEGGLKRCEGKLAHLGIEAPARLARSRQRASSVAAVRAGLLWAVRERGRIGTRPAQVSLQAQAGEPGLDRVRSVPVDVRLGQVSLNQRGDQAASGLDHDGYLPCFGVITDGSVHDVKVAQQIRFAPGTIVVDDRGYNDYRLFAKWTNAGVFFVTRMKDNAAFEVIEQREPPQNRGILCDQTIELSGVGAQTKCPHRLRRIEAVREDTGEILVFLTNHHELGASTVAAIYKERWQVELFFKALFQGVPSLSNLRRPRLFWTRIWG